MTIIVYIRRMTPQGIALGFSKGELALTLYTQYKSNL
jgi:hypothetical protein